MKFNFKSSDVYSGLAVVMTTGLTTAWVADYWVSGTGWVIRLSMLAVCLGLAVVAVALLVSRTSRTRRSVQRYIDVLCRLEPHQLANNDVRPDVVPSLRRDCQWDEAFNQLRDCLLAYSDRLQAAENDRDRAEVRARRLAAERQQMSEIMTSLSDPVVAIDQFDEVVLSNPSADEVLKIDSDNVSSRAVAQLVQCEALVDILIETRRRKSPTQRTTELELADDDGQSHWYSAAVRTTHSGGADVSDGDAAQGAVAVLRDISGLKAMQRRHAEFVSSVSHEMKTPLAGIKAYVELLLDGDAEDEATREEFLNVINGQADRLQRLIDNLLNIARIEAGVVKVNKKVLSMNDLMEEALRIVRPSADGKQVELINDLSPLYLGVLADRDMLLQTAINLLSNAIKYTPVGGCVTLRSRMQDDEVFFEVADTGVGLSREDQGRVFEKFYRVSSDKQMAPGTGLGLPLAKHIAEDVHGGSLSVRSEPGRGSTFQVTLPSARQMAVSS